MCGNDRCMCDFLHADTLCGYRFLCLHVSGYDQMLVTYNVCLCVFYSCVLHGCVYFTYQCLSVCVRALVGHPKPVDFVR